MSGLRTMDRCARGRCDLEPDGQTHDLGIDLEGCEKRNGDYYRAYVCQCGRDWTPEQLERTATGREHLALVAEIAAEDEIAYREVNGR